MTDKLSIDSKTTALLVMDFQMRIVDGFAADKEALLSRMARLLAAARDARMMVIYVVAGFRAGYPEISRRNMLFGALEGVWNLRRGGGRHGNSRI